MSTSTELITETQEIPSSVASCRGKKTLSLSKPENCSGLVSSGENSDYQCMESTFTEQSNVITSQQRVSFDDSASFHSVGSLSTTSRSVSSTRTEYGEREMFRGDSILCTPPKIPSSLRSSISEHSPSVIDSTPHAYGKEEDSGGEYMRHILLLPSTCDKAAVRINKTSSECLQNPDTSSKMNTSKIVLPTSETRSSVVASRLRAMLLFSILLLFALLAVVHFGKITAVSEEMAGECFLVKAYETITKMSLDTIFKDFKEYHFKMIEILYHQYETGVLFTKKAMTTALQIINVLPLTAAYISFVLSSILFGYAIFLGCRSRTQPKEYTEDVSDFIERIITVLVAHQQNLRPPFNRYLTVKRVRDLLIAPQDRNRLKDVWDAAVRTIEEKEFRGRIVIKKSNGGSKIWRYCPPVHETRKFPIWYQSSKLFDLPVPIGTTPYLKLRYMFNASSVWGQDWAELLKSAIQQSNRRLNIIQFWACEITNEEGIVYIQCSSKEDAGNLQRFLEIYFLGRNYEITFSDAEASQH